jgi:hypothetical protein
MVFDCKKDILPKRSFMETKRFSLDTRENNKVVNIIRIFFGILCVITAVSWTYYNFNTFKSEGTLWITILFLAGFGIYQVFSGLGRTSKYIEIGKTNLIVRHKAIFPPVEISSEDIEKIEFFPLNVVFFLKSKKRLLVRFGTTYYETNEKIVSELGIFADNNSIPYEVIEEKL